MWKMNCCKKKEYGKRIVGETKIYGGERRIVGKNGEL
jgi:hypothetical protein